MEFTGLSVPEKPFNKASVEISVPACFDTMKEIAAILAERIPFVRVDFYEVKGSFILGK